MHVPPILEIYVVWHPDDTRGRWVAETLLEHFRGATYSGLIGGAVEVYVRSDGWQRDDGPPRPLPFAEALPHGLPNAGFTAVVPVIGPALTRAVNRDPEWHDYIATIAEFGHQSGSTVRMFPFPIADSHHTPTRLAEMLQPTTFLRPTLDGAAMCRELSQEITHAVGDGSGTELQVFISHTKRTSPLEADDPALLVVESVRKRVEQAPRLRAFYDSVNLGAGSDWRRELEEQASTSALLVVRTDRYAGREWCQREVVIAKRADMPVVTLYAVLDREERGSFVMDHVPVIPLARNEPDTWDATIDKALDQLVSEALKRALWKRQRAHLTNATFAWLPANAPEPVTAAPRLRELVGAAPSGETVIVMHPDPPLGPAETDVLEELSVLAGAGPGQVDVLTPRTYASRGGRLP